MLCQHCNKTKMLHSNITKTLRLKKPSTLLFNNLFRLTIFQISASLAHCHYWIFGCAILCIYDIDIQRDWISFNAVPTNFLGPNRTWPSAAGTALTETDMFQSKFLWPMDWIFKIADEIGCQFDEPLRFPWWPTTECSNVSMSCEYWYLLNAFSVFVSLFHPVGNKTYYSY